MTLTAKPTDDHGNTFSSARAARLNRLGAGRLRGNVQYDQDIDMFKLVARLTGTMSYTSTTAAVS